MAGPDTKARKPRLTQAERTRATRKKVLDATIECLVEHGYSGTTSVRVAERAGVSRGAQLHHFPTRAQLVAEAVRQLQKQRTEEAGQSVVGEGRERIGAALDSMWETFNGPLFKAALELWVAARTDDELRAELVPTEHEIWEDILAAWAEVFGPRLAGHPDFPNRLQLAANVMRGIATVDSFNRSPASRDRQWRFARSALIDIFDPEGGV